MHFSGEVFKRDCNNWYLYIATKHDAYVYSEL